MDEGKFAAEFVSKNFEKLWAIAKDAYGNVDEALRVKIKAAYNDYLTAAGDKYSRSKSFFIRDRAVDLYDYYVPIGISCSNLEIGEPSFLACFSVSSRMVITGTGGSGKSVLMRHLFLDCLASKAFAPVLIELRDLNSESISLMDCISKTLENFKFNVSGSYIARAFKAGHFCLFLDGFDEVNHDIRKKIIKEIVQFGHKYPDCPVVISSRPDDVFNGLDDFARFKVVPLELSSAKNLVAKLPFDTEVKQKFDKDLDGLFQRHKSFLSNPLLLSIMLLTYGEHAEIPTKLSIFYNQAYETLFQRHDANKGGYSRRRLTSLDIQDFSRAFSLFSLQTYEKGLFKMSRRACLGFVEKSLTSLKYDVEPEDFMGDLLNAACLLMEDGLDVAYSHRSFQEYFVALYISDAAPAIQGKLLDRYFRNAGSDNVFNLLLELNPEVVERQVLIPKLEALFRKLGVKRSVGVTHAAKYLTEQYGKFMVEPDGISATIQNFESSLTRVVHMIVRHGKCAPKLKGGEYEALRRRLVKNFGNGEERFEVETKGMTYRTPFLAEMLHGAGAFSLAYLQAAHEEFKRLKSKHETAVQSLDTLLGI